MITLCDREKLRAILLLIELTELSRSPTCIKKFCDTFIVGYLANLGQFVHINPMIGPVITIAATAYLFLNILALHFEQAFCCV